MYMRRRRSKCFVRVRCVCGECVECVSGCVAYSIAPLEIRHRLLPPPLDVLSVFFARFLCVFFDYLMQLNFIRIGNFIFDFNLTVVLVYRVALCRTQFSLFLVVLLVVVLVLLLEDGGRVGGYGMLGFMCIAIYIYCSISGVLLLLFIDSGLWLWCSCCCSRCLRWRLWRCGSGAGASACIALALRLSPFMFI